MCWRWFGDVRRLIQGFPCGDVKCDFRGPNNCGCISDGKNECLNEIAHTIRWIYPPERRTKKGKVCSNLVRRGGVGPGDRRTRKFVEVVDGWRLSMLFRRQNEIWSSRTRSRAVAARGFCQEPFCLTKGCLYPLLSISLKNT